MKVHVRVRPVPGAVQCDLGGEKTGDPADGFIDVDGSLLQIHDVGKQHTSQFTFDDVFGCQASQTQLHEAIGQPMVDHVLSGYNACCFAYGQTGSGKTYSMVGEVHTSPQLRISGQTTAICRAGHRCIHAAFQNAGGYQGRKPRAGTQMH